VCKKEVLKSPNNGVISINDVRNRIKQLEADMQCLIIAHEQEYSAVFPEGKVIAAVNHSGSSNAMISTGPRTRSQTPTTYQNEEEMCSSAQRNDSSTNFSGRKHPQSFESISLIIDNFKHTNTCRILLTALQNISNLPEAIKAHNFIFQVELEKSNSAIQPKEINVMEFAWRALKGDDPLEIAHLCQIVAAQTTNIDISKNLISLVEQFIIADDDYFGKMEGLECAFDQGRLWMEIGHTSQAW